MPQCVVRVCGDEALEQHHLWPTALGGDPDGPKVWVCSNCHRRSHLCAVRIYRGKPIGETDEVWLQAAAPIINRIVRALRDSENMSLDDAPARIILVVSKRELRQIHLQKMDRGFSSLQAYLLALISADLPPSI